MGGSIPLPALDIKPPPQPENPLEAYGRVLSLKGMMQGQQLQGQQLIGAQQENQQRAIALKDAQAQSDALKEWDGKDINQLPVLFKNHGGSANGFLGLKNGILAYNKNLESYTTEQLANEKTKADLISGHIDSVKSLPPEQQPAAFEAAKADLVKKSIITPQQAAAFNYTGPDQLDNLEKTYQFHSQQIEDASKKAELAAKEAQLPGQRAESAIKTAEAAAMKQFGGLTQPMADSKYRFLQQQKAAGQQLNSADANFVTAYEKQKLLVPVASANVRIAGLQEAREYPVINKHTGELEMRNAKDINANSGLYAPAGEGGKAMNKTALIEDIRGNVNQVRSSLSNPNMPEFDAGMRAKIAFAMRDKDPRSAISALINSQAAKTLSPEQQDYLINTSLLVENALAMRSVLGAGQGSQDLREAVTRTIPGPTTPSKEFARKQLDQFEKVLDRLERGIPGMPLRGQEPNTISTPPGASSEVYAEDGKTLIGHVVNGKYQPLK